MSQFYTNLNNFDLIGQIQNGEIGIIPTDTVYGMVCLAKNQQSVERIYFVRQRDKGKALIILIDSIDILKLI